MTKGYWVAHGDAADIEAYKKYVAANAKPFKYACRPWRRRIW
jgi:uncharacterized protein (DUF1330 family)